MIEYCLSYLAGSPSKRYLLRLQESRARIVSTRDGRLPGCRRWIASYSCDRPLRTNTSALSASARTPNCF